MQITATQKEKKKKKKHIWKQASGGAGGGGWRGADRLALSRGQARQLLAHALMKDVSLSTQPRASLETSVGVALPLFATE